MDSIIIEIRGAEGGEDAKLLAQDMKNVYIKVAQKNQIDIEVLDNRPGFVVLHAEGKGAKKLFENESGGHRWQRVSPTEKRGRVHTSTVTVAILDSIIEKHSINLKDIEYIFTRGSGPGGQNRNKVESCVVAKHKPTGLSVRIDARDQHKNKALATRIIIERVLEKEREQINNNRATERKQQVGVGARGYKRRTYRTQDDSCVDHITNKRWQLSKWMRGNW